MGGWHRKVAKNWWW